MGWIVARRVGKVLGKSARPVELRGLSDDRPSCLLIKGPRHVLGIPDDGNGDDIVPHEGEVDWPLERPWV